MNAIVEKHNDEKGIIWPINVAPYKVGIIISNVNDKELWHKPLMAVKSLYNPAVTLTYDEETLTPPLK